MAKRSPSRGSGRKRKGRGGRKRSPLSRPKPRKRPVKVEPGDVRRVATIEIVPRKGQTLFQAIGAKTAQLRKGIGQVKGFGQFRVQVVHTNKWRDKNGRWRDNVSHFTSPPEGEIDLRKYPKRKGRPFKNFVTKERDLNVISARAFTDVKTFKAELRRQLTRKGTIRRTDSGKRLQRPERMRMTLIIEDAPDRLARQLTGEKPIGKKRSSKRKVGTKAAKKPRRNRSIRQRR